jgi:hypothetical protein
MTYITEYEDCATLGEKYGPDFGANVASYLNDAAKDGKTLVGILPNGSAAGCFIFSVDDKPAPVKPASASNTSAPTE